MSLDPIQSDALYIAPRNDVEAELARLWGEALGIEQVGINEHFLSLGGDSIFTIRVAAGIWDRFGVDISMLTMFELPTIAELAAEVIRLSK
jgi:acyl carrier protein